MTKYNEKKNQKNMTPKTSVPNGANDYEEDLLYTYKQKNETSQMRWNNNLCRKPRK
ncbi:hypothetical protein [uncultured Methanomethylovorans sp.]|uniref:hypothetical protein n=1 Tax=uncultured Methanomethylovorans sp. TaxID=183759 RepID=UPI002AA6E0F6|nr:hypothetical protein [uncultured Methanomethylovorans sp.]